MSKLLNADEAAKLLGVSRPSLYRYMTRGLLPRRFEQTRGLARRLVFDAGEVRELKRDLARGERARK